MAEIIFHSNGKEYRFWGAFGGEFAPDLAPYSGGFVECDNCIAPEHCAREGACLHDAVASVTTLRDATLEQLHQEVSRRRDELDAWKARIDESERAAPTWARLEPIPFDGGCACGDECGAFDRTAAHSEPAEAGEALPLSDWLEGHDEPLSEAHSNAVSDPDALLLLNVAGMLMRKGVTVEGIIARMCVFE